MFFYENVLRKFTFDIDIDNCYYYYVCYYYNDGCYYYKSFATYVDN